MQPSDEKTPLEKYIRAVAPEIDEFAKENADRIVEIDGKFDSIIEYSNKHHDLIAKNAVLDRDEVCAFMGRIIAHLEPGSDLAATMRVAKVASGIVLWGEYLSMFYMLGYSQAIRDLQTEKIAI
jgi:hypothetical protein